MKVEKMNSTAECINDTSVNEARKNLASIFSDDERRDDRSKVNPELGKAAIDVKNIKNDVKTNVINNGAVDFCKQVLGGYEKSLDQIYNDPLKIVQVIGDSLQFFREGKIKENCK